MDETMMMEMSAPAVQPVNEERLREFDQALLKYKAGKASVERRAISAENWWKLRNEVEREKDTNGSLVGFNCKSGWLHNVISTKHADLMESYPEPNILPREAGDRPEAEQLSKIIPVVLDQIEYGDVYSDCVWQKLKTGTGICKVFWDQDKLNGLGDIEICKVDVLNVFWEPGITDIQDSKYFFHTAAVDNDALIAQYPDLKGKLNGNTFVPQKFNADDNVSLDNKSIVIDCYYKVFDGNKRVLHMCKYVGGTILYSSENNGQPIYEHGLYPFVFDPLFPVEGSPCGYGFIDLCQNSQMQLDLMQTAFLRNTMVGAMPRYFQRADGAINEEELLDLGKPVVHVNGNLGDDSLKVVDYKPLSGNYINMREATIQELRQVSGNTETANGSTPSGVTAASAIAALQEASGKGSRDATRTTYRAYQKIILLVVELIRQFYDLPRKFRITGNMGMDQFVSYDNSGLVMQSMGMMNGEEMFRLPVFDISVEPAKRTAYSRISQNELALQFYNLGFFAPQQADQALSALQMMEFDGKDDVQQMISRNGTMAQQLAMFQQYALALTQKYEPDKADALAMSITGQGAGQIVNGDKDQIKQYDSKGEAGNVQKAREQSQQASQVSA